jgi:hypothetical protein
VIARKRMLALTVLLVAVAALAAAGVAAGHTARTCTGRSGSTLLQDRYARVFRHRGDVYACARGSTGVSTLASARYIKLAGRYVAWQQIPDRQSDSLNVLDTATGGFVTVGDALNGSRNAVEAITSYVLNAQGTIVWIFDSTICDPFGPGCNSAGYVLEHSYLGRTTLATATSSARIHPFTGLGISADGNLAYWLEYGQLQGARLY